MQFFVNGSPVCGDTVPLGVQGENLATQITADVSGWLDQWPDGQVIVRLIDANRQSHLADTVVDDGTLVWIVTAADTAQGGYGVGVVELVQGDVVKKSEPFATRVITDPAASGQAPEPVPGWVEETIRRMEELEAGAAQSADDAQTSAESAQTGAQSAQAAAAQAAQSAEDAAAVLGQVEAAGADQRAAIQAAGQQQTQAVTAAGAQQVSAVQTEGADQRAAIQTAGAAQAAAIQAEGQAQQTAIQQKGADTLASIPADYTELSGDVADLKSEITYIEEDVLQLQTKDEFSATSSRSWTVYVIGSMTLELGKTYTFTYSVPTSGTQVFVYLRNQSHTNIKQDSIPATATSKTWEYTCETDNEYVEFAFQVGTASETTVTVKAESNGKDRLSALEDEVASLSGGIVYELNLTGWENKGIVPGTGEIILHSKRLLTVIPKCAKSCLCDSGYSFAVFGWDGSTYLGWYNGSAWSKDPITTRTTELDLTGFVNYTLRVVLVNATTFENANDISINEGIHFKVKSPTDTTLANSGVPADAKSVGDAIPSIDNTLAIAGDAADAKATGDAISEIGDQLDGIITTEIVPNVGGYLKTNVSPVDISNPSSVGSNYKHIVYACSPGDEFTVYGRYVGTVADLYTFTDSSYNVLERCPKNDSNQYYYPVAPAYAAYVIFQWSSYSGASGNKFWKGISINTKIGALENAVANIEASLPGYNSPAYYKADDTQELVATYAGVIALYDALVAENPDYITKNTLTSNGFSNYEYVFTMGNRNAIRGQRQQDAETAKPIVLIMSGVHGYERCSVMGLYLFAKALCYNAPMSGIRNGLTIRIIPIVCPSGYNNNSRLNSNGVNINRNFDANWVQTEQGSDYSGAAPADQPETQIVQAWMGANSDAILAIDWHNSAYQNEISYLATCLSDGFAPAIKGGYFYGIDRITSHWINDRGVAADGTTFGYTGVDANNGTSCAYAKKVNLPGCLVETSWEVGDYGKDTPQTIGVNVEAFCAIIKGINTKYIEAN